MAKLYWNYGCCGAGKTTALLQVAHNYRERGMYPLILAPLAIMRGEVNLKSRIGISFPPVIFEPDGDMHAIVLRLIQGGKIPSCILVDEAQFCTRAQVQQLASLVDVNNVPVLCYGLRTDFRGELFEGSAALFALADSIVELKTICARKDCGKKATMHLKMVDGRATLEGPQVDPAATYESVCRRHWTEALEGRRQP